MYDCEILICFVFASFSKLLNVCLSTVLAKGEMEPERKETRSKVDEDRKHEYPFNSCYARVYRSGMPSVWRIAFYQSLFICYGRRGGLLVRSTVRSNHFQGHCVAFVGKTSKRKNELSMRELWLRPRLHVSRNDAEIRGSRKQKHYVLYMLPQCFR